MNKIYQTRLENGVTLEAFDLSRRYFGDFHQVTVDVVATVELEPGHFDSEPEYHAGRKVLGSAVELRKTLSRMGVPTAQVERVRNELLEGYLASASCYLGSAEFPARLVRTKVAKSATKKRGFIV